ncbi:tannase/feruloyl esterase family alpha/beta hydrolase [Streptomyces phaeochromogenes]|uniref:tannase/feruloyl esterase family alpha/beta hydrolase n=1 Tax=Streptomyces phaeochromogenes TaxID=1923 RepID=UPI002DD8659D|nr:tannase/feruloyl esterase family alpha/beta hydrolase [Streptomyces phaeochromogenes]WRZ34575.1 tannase/feruloyl esterase family alpha/beta hydrolase [Streptomyces phaeochromogenes]
MRSIPRTATALALALVGMAALGGPAAARADGADRTGSARCSDHGPHSIGGAFRSDPNTKIVKVKAFYKGDYLALPGTPLNPLPSVVNNDVCLVKLLVGPGNPGPADAPSTSEGIGMEIWLPQHRQWNDRSLALAAGGWMGDRNVASPDGLASAIGGRDNGQWAADDGYVVALSDGGRRTRADSVYGGRGEGMFSPDGSINATGWRDLSYRSTHQLALKTKVLTSYYYGRSAAHSYLVGGSSGGRAAYQSAQMYPGDFDGILAWAPSIQQTQLLPSDMYGQVVVQRDLGGRPIAMSKLNAVSRAAVNACDTTVTGRHDGYITDFADCRYNPVKDPEVLCVSDGGTNTTPNCVSPLQARAITKMWYGATPDGSVPSPEVDNGFNIKRPAGQIWWGRTPGTSMIAIAGSINGVPVPFEIVADQIALNLQDPSYATSSFQTPAGNGQDRWKSLSYAEFAAMMHRGKMLNSAFANIDSDNPDLTKFHALGKKMITFHGLADQTVSPQSAINYYTRSAKAMGGLTAEQRFHRLFLVPGMGHCAGTCAGTAGGSNPPMASLTKMLGAVISWVEQGKAPSSVEGTTLDGTASRPLCMYPRQATYRGGDVNAAASYRCS